MAKIVYMLFKSEEMTIQSKAIRKLEIDHSFLTIRSYAPMSVREWKCWDEWVEESTREACINYRLPEECVWTIETEMSQYRGRGTFEDFRRALCRVLQS